MKVSLVLALALFCAPAAAEPASPEPPVATIVAVSGDVMLAQHALIGPAEQGALLRPGDRLMTMDQSEVLIAFADGCSQRLADNALLAIGETSDCGPSFSQSRSFQQAIGDTGGGATTEPGMSSGQKTAVTAAVLIPLLWLWNHNRDGNGREPISR